MNNRWCWLGVLGIWGCSGDVDLGEADAPIEPLARGAKLVSFAPVPAGMCALFDNEQAYCWGKEGSTLARRAPALDSVQLAGPGSQGEICGVERDGSVACSTAIHRKRVKKLGVAGATTLSVGQSGGCSLTADGSLQCWTIPDASSCGTTTADEWLDLELPSPVVQIDHTDDHACTVTADGRVYCFGSNHWGEPGLHEGECVAEPRPIPDIEDAVQVALRMDYGCVLRSTGAVTCFGEGNRLGDGETNPEMRRIDVPDLNGVVAIKASRIATCALESTGTLKCWGLSECGSLGIFEECGFTRVSAPIVVQGSLRIQDFGMDDGTICALTDSDQIKCWGFSGWDGEAVGSPAPRRIIFQ